MALASEVFAAEEVRGVVSREQLLSVVNSTLSLAFSPGGNDQAKRVLLIHPDYSRHDFTDLLAPLLYEQLLPLGLEVLDTLNAGGTHRAMSQEELEKKLALSPSRNAKLGRMLNHRFDDPAALKHVTELPASFVREKTGGNLDVSLQVDVNRLVFADYDLIVAISGTVPHEALGYSGGTKIFFPGISGPSVIGMLHWAAVLVGIPQIIGTRDNPAREIVDAGTREIFAQIGDKPVLSLNMVYTEDAEHRVLPKGLYAAYGFEGFSRAHIQASALSSKLHIVYIDQAKSLVVQRLPQMYDEVWTAGKGSYKLQPPGVLSEGGEIILYAPHIHCFHSNRELDAAIRKIGYHGLDYVLAYCQQNPQFDKNVASHVINVRGFGRMVNGQEEFPFKVTLATQISREECEQVGLGYRDPASIRREDFIGPDKLWIEEGGQWLYARRS